MKKLLFILMILFGIIGFVGAGYVIYTGGEAGPGYGLIPMLFCLTCSQGCIALKKKETDKKVEVSIDSQG